VATEPVSALDLDFRVGLGNRELEVRLSAESQAVAVYGSSGGGKSTILRVLAGVETRARGTVRVGGEVWMDTSHDAFLPPWERRVGWVPQEYLLFPHLRVRDNLGFSRASTNELEEVAELLLVDHLLTRRPRRLSGGEQQRVALGRALLSRPKLLLLDEPFSALDRPLRSQVVSRLRDYIRERGLLLLLVSHDESDAVALAQEHWLLSEAGLERVE
jgi:molybdate transport system ATP-binding protein